jgi:hypothetical protein
MLIYKTLLGLTPLHLRYLLQPSSPTYNTRSASRSSFQFAAASDWNDLQQTLNLFIQRLIHEHLLTVVAALCDALMSNFLPFVLFVPNNVCTMFCVAAMLLSS